jgi:alanine racemase
MEQLKDRAWMEVSLPAICHNYHEIENNVRPGCVVMPVIKSDAYGLGAVEIATVLEREGCTHFAVACLEEAMMLRENGIKSEILILGVLNPEYTLLALENNIAISLVSVGIAKKYSEIAAEAGLKIRGHLKVDVGLSRLGIVLTGRMEEGFSECREVMNMDGIDVVGLFTQFTAQALPDGKALNEIQIARFNKITSLVKKEKNDIKVHCSCTYITVHYPSCDLDYVRVASLLLGLNSSEGRFDLMPSVSLKAKIIQIKSIPKGSPVGYGPLYYAASDMKIGVVAIGYADGLRRVISNTDAMMYKGKHVHIVGKISMEYSVIDVSAFPDAAEGDTVTVFGKDSTCEEEVWDFAKRYPGTVGEVTTALAGRITKFYEK